MPDVSKIIAYENGELSWPDTLDLFSDLIRTGTAWSLQGFYGRTAAHMIETGLISETGEIAEGAKTIHDEFLEGSE